MLESHEGRASTCVNYYSGNCAIAEAQRHGRRLVPRDTILTSRVMVPSRLANVGNAVSLVKGPSPRIRGDGRTLIPRSLGTGDCSLARLHYRLRHLTQSSLRHSNRSWGALLVGQRRTSPYHCLYTPRSYGDQAYLATYDIFSLESRPMCARDMYSCDGSSVASSFSSSRRSL
jgi:hypothetical protein